MSPSLYIYVKINPYKNILHIDQENRNGLFISDKTHIHMTSYFYILNIKKRAENTQETAYSAYSYHALISTQCV